MLLRLLCCALFCLLPQFASAARFCQDVVVGMAPGGRGAPAVPVFDRQCVRVVGAIAFDPRSRAFEAVWNSPDDAQALGSVRAHCGSQCVARAFEDLFYVAISEDDRAFGTSERNPEDAVRACQANGGVDCEAVLGASSTAPPEVWEFGALAYDPATGAVGRSANRARRRDAIAEARQACGSDGCSVFGFQNGWGAIARSGDGQLFPVWSDSDGRFSNAGRKAASACRKATGDRNCKIVATGAARDVAASVQAAQDRLIDDMDAIRRRYEEGLKRLEEGG